MRHLNSETLAAFVAVVDCGGFTAAADRIGKTQAAVSLIINRLEHRLGCKLLERTRHGVALSSQGEVLIGFARRMLALESEMLCAMNCGTDSTVIRIGMPDDYLDVLGGALLREFATRHPDVQVNILCDFSNRLEPLLAQGSIDLAVITRQPGLDVGQFLTRERQLWCTVSGRYPETDSVLPLALFADQCRARPRILAALDEARRAWRIVCSSSHLPGVRAAVELSGALTVLPESVILDGWRTLGRTHGLPDLPDLELALCMSNDASLLVRRVAQFIQGYFQTAARASRASALP
ncbi:LysR substrate-binding domain-containing protein [Castellaniella hirudinis]|uniref:LysR substrate-binding domain-containing protein n=1 Tax=Castellaniella hirudinis TaxID=1144617 RepID=A0ABV8S1V4_9BURK